MQREKNANRSLSALNLAEVEFFLMHILIKFLSYVLHLLGGRKEGRERIVDAKIFRQSQNLSVRDRKKREFSFLARVVSSLKKQQFQLGAKQCFVFFVSERQKQKKVSSKLNVKQVWVFSPKNNIKNIASLARADRAKKTFFQSFFALLLLSPFSALSFQETKEEEEKKRNELLSGVIASEQ